MFYINNGTTKRYHDLADIQVRGTDAAFFFNIFRGNPFSIPIDIKMMERHPYGSQAFFPVNGCRFLVVVAEDQAGIPQKPQAFITKEGEGVNYRIGAWHHPLLALEKTSDFVVIDRAGQEKNLEEHFYDKIYKIKSLALNSRKHGGSPI